MVPPLPEGEGRGEGEVRARPFIVSISLNRTPHARLPGPGSARAPAIRPASRARKVSGRKLALRSHHRILRPAASTHGRMGPPRHGDPSDAQFNTYPVLDASRSPTPAAFCAAPGRTN